MCRRMALTALFISTLACNKPPVRPMLAGQGDSIGATVDPDNSANATVADSSGTTATTYPNVNVANNILQNTQSTTSETTSANETMTGAATVTTGTETMTTGTTASTTGTMTTGTMSGTNTTGTNTTGASTMTTTTKKPDPLPMAKHTIPGGRIYLITNDCDHTIYFKSKPNPNNPAVASDIKMEAGQQTSFEVQPQWQGRMWVQESPNEATPYSLFEIQTLGYADADYYDISWVDGVTLPMTVRPIPGTFTGANGNYCKALECKSDIRDTCPEDLKVKDGSGHVTKCLSACEKYHTDQFCCLGAYAHEKCQPTNYSKFFDNACHDAYSFPEDIKTFSCKNADYEMILCPK